VLLFVLTGQAPPILLLALAILCYLTVWDLWNEDLPVMVKAWWVLLVFLTNLVGYAVLRIWLAARRRQRA
jgi:hypothetical protein